MREGLLASIVGNMDMTPMKRTMAALADQNVMITRVVDSIKPDLGVVNCPAVVSCSPYPQKSERR